MASCPKCGKPKVRRNKLGQRKCKRCGCLPSNKFLDRGGNPMFPKTRDLICEAIDEAIDNVLFGDPKSIAELCRM